MNKLTHLSCLGWEGMNKRMHEVNTLKWPLIEWHKMKSLKQWLMMKSTFPCLSPKYQRWDYTSLTGIGFQLSPLFLPPQRHPLKSLPPPSVFATLPDLVFSLNFISVPFAFLSWSPRQEAGAKREGTELETGIFLLTVSKEVRQGRRPGCLGCSSTVCSRLTWFEWSLTACQTQK